MVHVLRKYINMRAVKHCILNEGYPLSLKMIVKRYHGNFLGFVGGQKSSLSERAVLICQREYTLNRNFENIYTIEIIKINC